MNWDALGAIAEFIGGLGVILTLVYLSLQIRGSNRIASGHTRQAMSDFAFNISTFRAEHADRYARIASSENLTDGDKEFRYWSHMQMMVYGESHFHQFQLKLIEESNWLGLSTFLKSYVVNAGFQEFWIKEKHSFSDKYSAWIDKVLTNNVSTS